MQTLADDEMLLVSIKWKSGEVEQIFVDSFESLEILKSSPYLRILNVQKWEAK